jgi:crotonobetainyl-CoA:carnitine CoA-transferase CaiB-like acyl-CoA transferase
MPFEPASDVLSPYTVLDLTRVRSGPTCVRQLADWGANVIKIEDPESDKIGLGGARSGSDFQNLHRNKRSMTLNLKSKEGIAIFMALAKKADVIVENYRPDVKRRLGIDYEAVATINPRIIYASISGFGQDGPLANRPGFDQIAQGMGGLMSITGEPGKGPMRVGIPIADLTAGIFCSQGVLLALMERERSGKGQWVQTSLLQAQVFMLDFQASRWLMDQEIPPQAGNDHPTSIPTGVFKTSDGHINIAVAGQKKWDMFKSLFDDPAFNDAAYADPKSRSKNRKALNALIEGHTVKKSAAEWIAIFNKAGAPAGEINDIKQVFSLEQVRHVCLSMFFLCVELGDIEFFGNRIFLYL